LRKQYKEEFEVLKDLHAKEKEILHNKIKDLEAVIEKKTKNE